MSRPPWALEECVPSRRLAPRRGAQRRRAHGTRACQLDAARLTRVRRAARSSKLPEAAHTHKVQSAPAAQSSAKGVIFSDYGSAPVDATATGKRMPHHGARRRSGSRASVPGSNRSLRC